MQQGHESLHTASCCVLLTDLSTLQADMEKAQQAKRQHQEAERAEQAKRNEQEHAEQAQRDYERLISSKQAGLPEEAPAEDPSTVTIMVRLPNGTRASRRCRASWLFACACGLLGPCLD